MRSKKVLANVITSLLLQFTLIVSGFIIPWLIIRTYGSNVNGVIASITQFLGFFALLEGGVGGVVRSTLYKSLASKDVIAISRILKSAEKFFRRISYVFILFLLVMAIGYPYLVSDGFDKTFIFTLVIILGIKTIAQYFFGITYQILLQADQKSYVTSFFHIIAIIFSTIIATVLINLDTSIRIVQLFSAGVFILKPIGLHLYVKHKYKIITNCDEDKSALNQKWDGIGHHIAYFLHNRTDIVVLTLFTNIKEVSVYSIYMMVAVGIRNVTTTFSSAIEAVFGDMLAKREKESLENNFNIFEFLFFMITTILFTSAALLILPFVSVYTKGVTDANYFRPLFAYILLAAEAAYCIRLPYHSVVIAAGHFKQTRNGAFLEAAINIVLSLILVNHFGLIGVAIGTLCSMIFRTVQYALYLSKNILNRSILKFIKRVVVNFSAVLIVVIVSKFLPEIVINNYFHWIIYACEITVITVIVTLLINSIIYYAEMRGLVNSFKKMIKRKF
ncbi:polysaccharide biosynthesis C-terminal domain-containing protein [Peribacillus simplex]|uniref:lipopolysaccharide biosynthesis protein n=1 Tax=Peribacillus simplex TaxID=1478 RepID=UPI00298E405B|nr:polysaccharide biosynthesis C-terminal domain-containing protein [Peribacillus simplex]MDW7613457.1 polysaccharide biosynthesis C-terminal domain-containing protein [Peribacillus simplex]